MPPITVVAAQAQAAGKFRRTKSCIPKKKTDEELYADFRAAAKNCQTCRGSRTVKVLRNGEMRRSRAGMRCPVCQPEQSRIFNLWLSRPVDGKRSWRDRIQGYVHKNMTMFGNIVGNTIGHEDVEQDVMLAVWMVWDKYYDPTYKSPKTGKPVKLCTYVWKSIQTAWAKVTERCFSSRNTVYMIRKGDGCDEATHPIYDPVKMHAVLLKLSKVDPATKGLKKLVEKCYKACDGHPFSYQMLQELVRESKCRSMENHGEKVTALLSIVTQVAKKHRNAVPVHMVTRHIDTDSGDDDTHSSNRVEDMDYRFQRKDEPAVDLADRVRAEIVKRLDAIDQHIFFDCMVAQRESVRTLAETMSMDEVKRRMQHIEAVIAEMRASGKFDALID